MGSRVQQYAAIRSGATVDCRSSGTSRANTDCTPALPRQAHVEIIHPLTEEPWGVTRFFYRASDGRVINVGMHTQLR